MWVVFYCFVRSLEDENCCHNGEGAKDTPRRGREQFGLLPDLNRLRKLVDVDGDGPPRTAPGQLDAHDNKRGFVISIASKMSNRNSSACKCIASRMPSILSAFLRATISGLAARRARRSSKSRASTLMNTRSMSFLHSFVYGYEMAASIASLHPRASATLMFLAFLVASSAPSLRVRTGAGAEGVVPSGLHCWRKNAKRLQRQTLG